METSRFARPARKARTNGMNRAAVLSYRPPDYETAEQGESRNTADCRQSKVPNPERRNKTRK